MSNGKVLMLKPRIAIIGAGAAGLMTAIQCGLRGISVEIFDSQKNLGKKILIAGGGRCNITNKDISEKKYNCENPRFVKNVLKHFSLNDTLAYFESRQLLLKCEPEFNKYFPVSDKAADVLQTFLDHIAELKIPLYRESRITDIKKNEKGFQITLNEKDNMLFDKIVLSTGGKSIPQTGSNGFGYELARSLGHSITELNPALTPLLSEELFLESLSGYSLPCEVSMVESDKKIISFSGPLLFTHKGYSGPVILNVSRHFINRKSENKKLVANWLPSLNKESLSALWKTQEYRKKTIQAFLREKFSRQFADVLLEKSGIKLEVSLSEISSEQRKQIELHLFDFPLKVTGFKGFAFAEVTSGGIALSEIELNTLESKIHKNLYFTGEILDVDGQLGGYNFQWAFASAACVANAIKNSSG
jgi:predicted Rossmann fold flavoprotein